MVFTSRQASERYETARGSLAMNGMSAVNDVKTTIVINKAFRRSLAPIKLLEVLDGDAIQKLENHCKWTPLPKR